jgi:heme/copper-type cytochrome/quinol oxidase subunit 2
LRGSRVLPVKIIAHEWWWEFDYPTLGIKASDALHLPSGRSIRLELQSADVIHSFWISGMDKAIDLPPGKTRHVDLEVKSPGELHGNCDAGCGCGTVCMRFRVLASTPSDFNLWAARQLSHPEPKAIARTVLAPACALDKSVDHPESAGQARTGSPGPQSSGANANTHIKVN